MIKSYPYYKDKVEESLSFARTNKIRARYIGYVGFGNLGDEAILRATKNIFREEISFYARMKIDLLNKYLKTNDKKEAIFLGGGTLIKATSSHLKRLKKNVERNDRTKFIVFGTGVGDDKLWKKFGQKTKKEEWVKILNKSDFLGVRGKLSKKFLKSWGIKKSVDILGDPAIHYALPKIPQKNKKKRIGVNLGPSRGEIFGQDEEYVIDRGAKMLRVLKNKGWNITFFAMVDKDVPYIKKACEKAEIENFEVVKNYFEPKSAVKKMSKMDVFVGEKLHSVVLSSCAYVPSVMLAYRTKCIDFMKSIERGGFIHKTDRLNVQSILDDLYELYDNKKTNQKEIFSSIRSLKKNIKSGAKNVKEILL